MNIKTKIITLSFIEKTLRNTEKLMLCETQCNKNMQFDNPPLRGDLEGPLCG